MPCAWPPYAYEPVPCPGGGGSTPPAPEAPAPEREPFPRPRNDVDEWRSKPGPVAAAAPATFAELARGSPPAVDRTGAGIPFAWSSAATAASTPRRVRARALARSRRGGRARPAR